MAMGNWLTPFCFDRAIDEGGGGGAGMGRDRVDLICGSGWGGGRAGGWGANPFCGSVFSLGGGGTPFCETVF